jgi:hypothetical protein
MQSLPRTTQFLKWTLTLICVVLSFAWMLSDVYVFILNGPQGAQASITGGQLCLSLDTPPLLESEQPKTGIQEYYSEYRWGFEVVWRSAVKAFYVPMWFIITAFAGFSGYWWRREYKVRRARSHGACHGCGYDRRGILATAKCPECGAVAQDV